MTSPIHKPLMRLVFTCLFLFCSQQAFSAYFYSSYGHEEQFYKPHSEMPKAEGGVETVITFHQRVISEADGPRSSYYPSSSQYMLTAVRRLGLKGFFLGCDRLLRENNDKGCYLKYITRDGHELKYDPVP